MNEGDAMRNLDLVGFFWFYRIVVLMESEVAFFAWNVTIREYGSMQNDQ